MNSTGFVRAIKRKLHDWESRNLWTARIFEYGFRILLVTFVIAIIFALFNLIHTNANSARYMLSALVQSQAAIVAIVVSLTLVAVQLTASAYSPRVVRIFLKNPDMWLLLLFYGFSIFLGLFVLKMIPEAGDLSQIMILSRSLEAYITYVYALGISTFVILCLYMGNIINLLEPANIINRLAMEITKDNLVPTKIKIPSGKSLEPKEDPVQPIMDIVHGSITKWDTVTATVGVNAITERLKEIINSDHETEITSLFVRKIRGIWRHSLNQNGEDLTEVILINLKDFWKSALSKELWRATNRIVIFSGEVGEAAAKKRQEEATRFAIESLLEFGTSAPKNCPEPLIKQAAEPLAKITLSSEKVVITAISEFE